MADNTITHGAPGIAEFSTETWANATELRLSDTPAMAIKRATIAASGADLDLGIYSVVSASGLADQTASDAIGILPYAVAIADGTSLEVDLIVAGNYDINALAWDETTFDSDAKKIAAFDGLAAPINIILGTNPYDSDGVLA